MNQSSMTSAGGTDKSLAVPGLYRSGTNDDADLIQANVDTMADIALVLFRHGHLAVLGEWFALP